MEACMQGEAAQQGEARQAVECLMFGAHEAHMDQAMLAQAHAAMLTIESEGARQHDLVSGV